VRKNYEYIVLGCGGIGSGALYWLSRRDGSKVLGLEQFEVGHHHGGSQDHSRIIRLEYHHQKYTRLTRDTYTAWATLEAESAVQLVTRTGGIRMALAGSPHRREIDHYAGAMDAANIPYERIGSDELMRRYPQFRLDQEVDALFQSETGIVDAIKGNAAHIAVARHYGATIIENCGVGAIRPFQGGVELHTGQGNFTCRQLIVTAGAWTDETLASIGLNLQLTVTQEQVTYYATSNLRDFAVGSFPVFIWQGDDAIYGFPVYGEAATKAAIDAGGPPVTPETRTYEADEKREHRLENWLREYIPGFLGPKLYTKTCLYTLPRDRDFVVDFLPEHPQILVCIGAGHGYKFASLLGKILSELAIDGRTDFSIESFTLRRAAITDPDFAGDFRI
jgi:sarcosine oxidase